MKTAISSAPVFLFLATALSACGAYDDPEYEREDEDASAYNVEDEGSALRRRRPKKNATYCKAADVISAGADYYQQPSSRCENDDYPNNAGLKSALKTYKDDQAFQTAVCAAFPVADRPFCDGTKGIGGLLVEATGFFDTITLPVGKPRTEDCDAMIAETTGQVKGYLGPFLKGCP
jgi:hypothetical protein